MGSRRAFTPLILIPEGNPLLPLPLPLLSPSRLPFAPQISPSPHRIVILLSAARSRTTRSCSPKILSSPQTCANRPNLKQTNHIAVLNGWHTSYGPTLVSG